MPACGGLHANLMHAPGHRLEFDQRAPFALLQDAIAQHGALGAGRFGFRDLGARLVLNLAQPVLPRALGRLQRSLDGAPVSLRHLMLAKLLR